MLILAFSVDHTPPGLTPSSWPLKTTEEKQKIAQHAGPLKPLKTVHFWGRERKPSNTDAGAAHLSGMYRRNISFELIKFKGYS